MTRDDNAEHVALAKRFAALSPAQRTLLRKKRAAGMARGADLLAQSLRQCGVTHVYAVAGGPTQQALPAVARLGLRVIGACHQTAATLMALAHNYQAGRLAAIALVSAGPAVSNAVTGLLVARENGWPVLVLGGQQETFQRFDATTLCRSVAKSVVVPRSAAEIPAAIAAAAGTAMAGRPGPVYVDLHGDVLAAAVRGAAAPCGPSIPASPPPDPAEVPRVLEILRAARRPAAIIGEGVRWTVRPDLLREAVEAFGLAVITSPMGRGFLSDEHPLCFNQARSAVQNGADVVLVIGARLDWRFRHGAELSGQARVFLVDAEPEAAPAGPAVQTLALAPGMFLEALRAAAGPAPGAGSAARAEWHRSLRAIAAATARRAQRHAVDERLPMSPYRAMAEIRRVMPEDALCITDGNIALRASQAMLPSLRPASRMDPGAIACMGVGVPFAIGARVAVTDRPVLLVTGDYAFCLSAMELDVCVRQRIPVIVVVINNEGNCGATKQHSYFSPYTDERVTQSQSGLQYDTVMRMFGGEGITVADPQSLRSALRRALAGNRPACINVLVDPDTAPRNAWGEQATGESG